MIVESTGVTGPRSQASLKDLGYHLRQVTEEENHACSSSREIHCCAEGECSLWGLLVMPSMMTTFYFCLVVSVNSVVIIEIEKMLL